MPISDLWRGVNKPAVDGTFIFTRKVPIHAIRPAPWNPRVLDDADFQGLQQSLVDDPTFFDCHPVLVRKATMEIYAGSQRWRAAQQLGWTEVPAIITDITERTAKERAAKHNAHHGQNSSAYQAFLGDLASGGLDLATVGHGIKLESSDLDLGDDRDDDGRADAPREIKVHDGDLWQLGNSQLTCHEPVEDCEAVIRFWEAKTGYKAVLIP